MSPGQEKDIFSTNLSRLSRQETVHLVEHSGSDLQKWFGSGLNATRIKKHVSSPVMLLNMFGRKEDTSRHASLLSCIIQQDDVMFEAHILRQTL